MRSMTWIEVRALLLVVTVFSYQHAWVDQESINSMDTSS